MKRIAYFLMIAALMFSFTNYAAAGEEKQASKQLQEQTSPAPNADKQMAEGSGSGKDASEQAKKIAANADVAASKGSGN
ncbi:hypothetical protein SAMN02745165_02348 [Malonomonas rubra DSM 5091]|uniref:Uncharacterized protein n=1 Tax=Malonomonas rubra DSM 5091 TaxID=1122189 RepID=A0A1M6J8Y2_MALRU|nr:hypothetical protein [Malonomonas rubra]SHJ43149.1 hypothetical protein SAMN02745165_02348 [Malonomonas rubra DSM 5091]